MVIRFGDKPLEMFKQVFPKFDAELNVHDCTSKVDGWRTWVIKDKEHTIVKSYPNGNTNWARGKNKDLFFLSRRGFDKGGPTNIPVKEEIVETVDNFDLPNLSMLDSEWLDRRTIGEIPESLFLLDVLWYQDEWIGGKIWLERKPLLFTFQDKVNNHVRFPLRPKEGQKFSDFFEEMKSIPWTEGIVLRHNNNTQIGDRTECKKNATLIKIKWRSGSSGREEVKIF